MARFEGKVIAITGSASGIGRACAIAFASEGATVYGGDLDEVGNKETARLATSSFTPSHQIDLRNESEVTTWISDIVKKEDRLDALVAAGGSTEFGKISEFTVDQWRRVMALELDVVFIPLKAAWPHLIASAGNVVLIGSTAAVAGSVTNDRIAHSTAKGGIVAMVRQIAAEGASYGLRANSVSPGVIETSATRRNILADGHPMKNIAQSIPLGRVGNVEDVSNAILFLASAQASYITGTNLMVDGGWSAVLPSSQN